MKTTITWETDPADIVEGESYLVLIKNKDPCPINPDPAYFMMCNAERHMDYRDIDPVPTLRFVDSWEEYGFWDTGDCVKWVKESELLIGGK